MTVVYSAECKAVQKADRAIGLLPILVVLFVFSYAILTALVVEQGRTIDSQRALIREMLKDSNQLAALKGKVAHDESLQNQQKAPASGSATANQKKDSAGSPKVSGKDRKGGDKSPHSMQQIPGKPPSDLEDVRRSTHVI